MNRKKLKIFKRIAGIMTVIVIVSTSMPVWEITGGAKCIFKEITAYAEEVIEQLTEETTEPSADPSAEETTETEPVTEKETESVSVLEETEDIIRSEMEETVILQEGENDGYEIYEDKMEVNITSLIGLTNYSKIYESNQNTYCEYDIVLTFQGASTDEDTADFKSIGNENCPFKGDIKLTDTNNNKIILSTPMFDYISDSSRIITNGSEESKELIIQKVGTADSEPLFANHVVHDASPEFNKSEWIITVDTSSHDFAGIVSTIEDGAKVNLSITNKANSNSYNYNSSDGNSGLACGTMGENSELAVSYSFGENPSLIGVKSTGGNAGGLVGEMKSGSKLVLNSEMNFSEFTVSATDSANGCAGGLVGKATDAEVVFNENPEGGYYKVTAKVNGTKATGGVFGCYVNSNTEREFQYYNTVCDVTGNNAGGVFGELQNKKTESATGSITFDQTNNVITKRTNSSADTAHYGGLIGLYTADNSACALNIVGTDAEKLNVTISKTGKAANYGGIIGATGSVNDTPSNTYVYCSNVTVKASGCNNASTYFGGFIGKQGKCTITGGNTISYLDSGFLDINNFTVEINNDGKGNRQFRGGGVVGNMDAGVLQFSGYTNLDATECVVNNTSNDYKDRCGQIVGLRGYKANEDGQQSLIYAVKGWELIRSRTPVKADDIGTWGEVIRFSDKLNIDDVLVCNTTEHTVTVKEIGSYDSTKKELTISNPAEFARLAINMKVHVSTKNNDNNTIQFANPAVLANDNTNKPDFKILIKGDIDLTGTGITGIFRDNGANAAGTNSYYGFTKTIDGKKEDNSNSKITLAIGEPYGYRMTDNVKTEVDCTKDGDGKIYRHRFVGLTAKTLDGAAYHNLNITGTVNVEPLGVQGYSEAFIGSFAAQNARGIMAFNNVKTDVEFNITNCLASTVRCGGLIGQIYEGSTITIKDSVISPTITATGDKDICTGGAIGDIRPNTSLKITAEDITIGAKIKNSSKDDKKRVGGFIAAIYNADAESSSRTVSLKKVFMNGVTIENNQGGALLGEDWYNVDVIFGEKDSNGNGTNGLTINNCKITQTNTGGFAGLITNGTGYWQVHHVNINNITVDGGKAESFGMFVNNSSIYDSKFTKTSPYKNLYLEFTNNNAYKIKDDKPTLGSVKYFDEILVFAHKDKAKDTGKAVNGNCSVVSIHTEDNGNPTVIMGGANCNTYSNQTNFLKSEVNSSKRNNPYVRYYYNIDTIRAKEDSKREPSEKLLLWSVGRYAHDSLKKYFSVTSFNEISLDNGRYSYTIPPGEYDMNGYSYYPIDIADNVTIGGDTETIIKFSNSEFDTSEEKGGNRLTTDSNSQHYQMQSGLFRNCSGSVTMNNVSLGGNIGKVVSNNAQSGAIISGIMSGTIDSPAELICKDITLDGIVVNSVDSETDYAPLLVNTINSNSKLTLNDVSTTGTYIDGTLAASSLIGNVGSSDADNIKIVFSKIILDSRTVPLEDTTANTALDTAYNTTKSIFTKATLLNQFIFPENGNCSAVYNYRYEEDWNADGTARHQVTYGKEIIDSQEYRDTENNVSLECNYLNSDYFTDPENALSETAYPFNNGKFLPYVKDKYSSTNNFHEIKVNVPSPNFDDGCGTYNDPYIISNANQLDMLSDFGFADGTIINYHENNYKSWCTKTGETPEHTIYIKDGDCFYPAKADSSIPEADTSQDGITDEEMQAILSTAYYKIEANITLKDTFKSIGKQVPFMGVIDGNDQTITNENTVPFIYNSKGSVVKDLNLVVNGAFTASASGDSKYETDGGNCPFYGGLIGIVNGGDNIIDNVDITFKNASGINISSATNPGNIAIGGYIGVVRYGGVVFRNMEQVENKYGITANENSMFNCDNAENNFVFDSLNKVYLYCNPIIGRVIDGFAVTETSKYKTSGVTMNNGTKNYSITDINKSSAAKLSFSTADGADYKITVSDSQSLFLMGCITNSGAGKYDSTTNTYPTLNQLFGYGNDQMVRHGDYSDIGSDAESSDFTNNVESGDLYSGDIVPYLVYKYTAESVTGSLDETYPARTLTSSAVFDIEFTGGEYTLPQGFRGIGTLNDTQGALVSSNNVYTADSIRTIAVPNEYSQMKLHSITGNNAVINLNTSYYSYSNTYDKYTRNFVTGLGLFGTLLQNYDSTTGGAIENLTIKGSIKADKFKDDGTTVYDNDCFHIGGLAGTALGDGKCDIMLNHVNAQSLTIDSRSSHAAGGLIGYLRSNDGSSTFKAENCGASAVTVNSYRHAGGLIGYAYDYSTTIGNESDTIQINKVSPKVINNTNTDWKNVLNSAGCVIGGTYNKSHTFKNITIDGGTITANGTYTAAGSLIGCANDINVTGVADEYEYTISGITVNGVSIDTENSTTNIVYSGGLIGALKSFISANCTISDCHVVGQSNGNTIKATSVVSGLIAVDNMKTTIDKCSVENYSLSANISNNNNPCGGLIGKVERNDTILKNSYIKKCTIQYNGNVSDAKRIGGIAGYVNDSITFSGYNVAVKDVNIVNSNTTNVGTAMGGVNSTASAKFVGVSISGNTGDAVNTFGSSKGKDSYVICSDMNGTCLDASPNSEHSNVNFTDIPHIEDYGSSPYAAINPKTDIDSSMFLTGDGASAALKDNAELSDYKFSTFAAEMGLTEDSLTYDFPVLVVNESDKDTLTNSINTYIKILTGTNYQIAPKSDVNYADPDDAANSQLFNIDISQYKLNDAGDSFEKNENLSDKSLTCSGRYFQMTNKHYDNANNQFTLLDVQFKNPLDTAQIAYHLYIPIVVVKMLKFDFNTGISSGTTYKTDLYTNKVAMENYGSPVTTYIEYSYQRTVKEWNDALNAGENFLKYYGKFVHFDYSSDTKFNDDTNLVLVDCNNGDKAYYSALGTCFDKENTKKLDFHAFKDSSDTPFEPVSFYELLKQSADITAALNESGNGKFVKLDNETEAAVKAVLDGNECYFRLKDSAKDTADIQTYDIEIKALNESLQAADILPVKEKYYLSIFTNIPEAADSIVQVKIESFRRLGDDDMTPSLVNNNNPSTMIVGNLYKQEISFSTDPLAECKISEDNSVIKVNELQSTISINAADPTMIQAIKYNMATVNLFHGFVLDMNITDADGTRNGIYGTPQVTGSYSINSKEYDIDYSVSNFVITITGKDCGQAVKEALINNNNNSVTISCSNLEIDYYESSDINGQFPIRPDGNTAYGAIVYAKSNIAYDNSDNVKNSNTSVSQRDTYEKSFYIEGNLKIASLNYNIPTGTTDADKFAALGVNGRVSEEHINAVGYYDVSDISEDVLSTAKRLIVSFELQRKNSDGNYTSNEILIPDYLSGFTLDVNGSDNLFDVNNSAAPIEYEISAIPTDKTFKINTSFNVITGEKFEEKGYLYSNYRVVMKVSLYQEDGEMIPNSSAEDYIVYTNAKLFTEFIPRT